MGREAAEFCLIYAVPPQLDTGLDRDFGRYSPTRSLEGSAHESKLSGLKLKQPRNLRFCSLTRSVRNRSADLSS